MPKPRNALLPEDFSHTQRHLTLVGGRNEADDALPCAGAGAEVTAGAFLADAVVLLVVKDRPAADHRGLQTGTGFKETV